MALALILGNIKVQGTLSLFKEKIIQVTELLQQRPPKNTVKLRRVLTCLDL